LLLALFGLFFLPAGDHGEFVVVIQIDDFLPEHSAFILKSIVLSAAFLELAFFLAYFCQPFPEVLDFFLQLIESFI
jgi:hypothetical protein